MPLVHSVQEASVPTEKTAWVVLGSSGQWSDWSQWPVAAFTDEQAAKDYVGNISARVREHFAKKPEMTDVSYDSGKWDRAMKRWRAKGNRIDPMADEYDQPNYTAQEVPFFAETTTASSVGTERSGVNPKDPTS